MRNAIALVALSALTLAATTVMVPGLRPRQRPAPPELLDGAIHFNPLHVTAVQLEGRWEVTEKQRSSVLTAAGPGPHTAEIHTGANNIRRLALTTGDRVLRSQSAVTLEPKAWIGPKTFPIAGEWHASPTGSPGDSSRL